MNVRPLNRGESANLAALNQAGCNSVLLFVTATGLQKSILDATEPMRKFFREARIHDYTLQGQGQDSKVSLTAFMLTESGPMPMKASLYRPTTKQGDPRIWFGGFGRYVRPDDVCSIFVHDDTMHILNLTQGTLAARINDGSGEADIRFLEALGAQSGAVALELLARLRDVASRGPLMADCVGDTAIGRSIETALGIPINSDRWPDFKGIEIKSGRTPSLRAQANRATLFACVPDWTLSSLKSSAEILDRFGYNRDGAFKLYCTVSARGPNSQGLQLNVDEAIERLREFHAENPVEDVCIWRLQRLHEYLSKKHHETFWVKADADRRGGKEWFTLRAVVHTTRPSIAQFDRMLTDGTVTLDHLIKRQASGGAREKGPLFKIVADRVPELFLGLPKRYSLDP